jgi:MFS family permease
MAALVGTLAAVYMVTQTLRNSIGVIAPNLAAELNLSAAEIGLLSSTFFLAFASAQLPLGVALDRFGPKRTMLVCAGIVIIGVLLFAHATTPAGLIVARAMIGAGSCCYLMAPLAFYARRFSPERFSTLAGIQLGLGSIGTLLATAPLAFSAATIGWRATFVIMAAAMAIAGILVAAVVPRDETVPTPREPESLRESVAGIFKALRTPSVGRLFLMHLTCYPSFVLIVGLWGGPYLTHVYGYDLEGRGDLLFITAVGQIAGMMLVGPLERRVGSSKIPVLVGAGLTAAALLMLAIVGSLPSWALVTWLAAFGVITAFTPLLIAHGKALFPPELVGRGMTVLNIGTMVGAFLSQTLTGAIITLFEAPGGVYPLMAYRVVFALQAVCLLLSCLAYLGSYEPRENSDRTNT